MMIPMFSENGITLIRLPLGAALKCEAHDISVFRVEKWSVQTSVLLVL